MLPVVLVAVLPMSRGHLGAAGADAEGSWAGFLLVTVVHCTLLFYPRSDCVWQQGGYCVRPVASNQPTGVQPQESPCSSV